MDTDTLVFIGFLLVTGAALGILVDSVTKGMYVPRHWHMILFPSVSFLIGLHVWEKYKNDLGAFLIMLAFIRAGLLHADYCNQSGVMHQGYQTTINTPDPKITLVDAQKQWPELQLIKRENFQPIVTSEQVVEMPAFNLERYFWKTVLQMYDMDPDTQQHVDLTEDRWVIQKKVFAQKPFEYVKKRGAHFGLLGRKNKNKNSKFIVASRIAVAMVAAGNPLPEWSPVSPTPSR